ncbi:MAG TPA: hypothetical protein VF013_06210 [Candidatus Limnocylindria bacterium]
MRLSKRLRRVQVAWLRRWRAAGRTHEQVQAAREADRRNPDSDLERIRMSGRIAPR